MKQTNNAIKFLMAQYRAIFKNANLKMFLAAATAAAAMASTQAQATAANWADIQTGTGDSISADAEFTGTKAKEENTHGFTLNITGGTVKFIGGGGAATSFEMKDASGSILQTGGKILIGDTSAAQGASVKVNSFTSTGGEIVIGGHASDASSLEADTIVLGGETPVSIKLDKKGTLGNAKSAISLTTGSALTLEATPTDAAIVGNKLTLIGGTLTVDGAKDFKISSKTVDVKEGSTFSNGTGTVTFDKATSISFAKNTLTNTGKLALGTIGGASKRNVEIKADAEDFSKLFKGNEVQVTVSGDAGGAGTLTLTATGDAELQLKESGLYASDDSGKVDVAKGLVVDAAQKANVNLKVTANNASLSSPKLADSDMGGVTLEFGSFTGGNGTDPFSFESAKTALTVKSALTVSGGKNLILNSGSTLNLVGAGDVSAGAVQVGSSTDKKDGNLKVSSGAWTIGSLDVQSGSVAISDSGKLILNKDAALSFAATGATLTADNGTLDAAQAGVTNLAAKDVISLTNGSRVVLDAADVYTIEKDGSVKVAAGDGKKASLFTDGAVKADGTSFLEIKSQDTVDAALAAKIQKAVASAGFGGFIDFGDKIEAYKDPSVKFSEMTNGVNGMYANTQVVMDGADNNINKSLSAGNLKLSGAGTSAEVADGNRLILTNANTELGKGMFIQDADGKVAGANLAGANSDIVLNGTGKVGSITAAADKNGNVTIGGDVNGNGTVTVEGAIGKAGTAVKTLTVNKDSTLVVAGNESDKGVYTDTLSLKAGSSLKADGQTVTVTGTGTSSIDGNLTAKALTFSTANAGAKIANDAFVDVEELSLTAGTGTIEVGTRGDNGTSGTLEVGKLTLNGGTLEVDPAIGKKASVAALAGLSKVENGAQVLDGNIVVGENSVVGVGYDTRAEIESMLETLGYMDPATQGFMPNPAAPEVPDAQVTRAAPAVENTLKAAFIVNTPITIADGKGILVDSAHTAGTNATGDKVQLGADSAMIITDAAYTIVDGKKTGTAITFGKTTGASSVSADASAKYILAGAFDGADAGVKIFGSTNGSQVTGADGATVVSANGVLVGTLGADGAIKDLSVKAGALDGKFATVATPVADLLKARIDGKDPRFDKSQLGAEWLLKVAMDAVDQSGVKADAAAHAATYAGAQVAAVASVGTMAEAVGGRVGSMGVEATTIAATGTQANGGVWVSPMYKSVDADGFSADGASYGADVDLAGVAFGADTVNGNMRFGAVFNIGSGDADGKGNGNGLKDEFDYYGFGMYTAMGFGNFALVGDASLNVISHDVEGLGAKGSADTTAVTMGVTGQYTISNPAVDVTPHLGARFIRLDTDSYDLTVDGKVLASTDFEVQNVFSIPLGVTLSKAFEMGGWSLAPSADLSITFNTGDTDAKSTTQFTGAYGIDLTSEVLDEVTYGVAVGLGAQYGAFGTQIGINYTGSENTDALGVNAQARYMF